MNYCATCNQNIVKAYPLSREGILGKSFTPSIIISRILEEYMIIPGIKIGPQQWQERIAIGPKFVEVWYQVDHAEMYVPLFSALQQQGIPFGLHFWGTTSSGHEANLAYPGKIWDESVRLMSDCLEVAAAWQAIYVNIHSGNISAMQLTLNPQFCMLPDETLPIIENEKATNSRNQALEDLGRIAHEYNTALLVELIPQATYNNGNRLIPIPEYPAGIEGLQDLCQRNLIGFTNDFCHTFSMNPQNFHTTTKAFNPYTHLCHINTLYEPYNGTDAHGGILNEDFSKPGVFPTLTEYQDLLRPLQDLPHDVYAVGEPTLNHIDNYHALVNLISSL